MSDQKTDVSVSIDRFDAFPLELFAKSVDRSDLLNILKPDRTAHIDY